MWPFKRRHRHVWEVVGYGGAGWFSVVCTECGLREIG